MEFVLSLKDFCQTKVAVDLFFFFSKSTFVFVLFTFLFSVAITLMLKPKIMCILNLIISRGYLTILNNFLSDAYQWAYLT